MHSIGTTHSWVTTPRGRLYVKCWQPRAPRAAPVLLFHDSLGCVELWRDFPARLSAATGRKVIAYDRLGFARSSARTDALDTGFIADEALRVFPALCEQLALAQVVVFGH